MPSDASLRLLFELAALFLRHSPLETGRYRLLQFARPIGRALGPKLGRRTVRTRGGFLMELDLADWIPQNIYLTGDFETDTSTLVKQLLRPGDLAIDVGANIGYFSLLFARCVGDAGRVLAFEPVPSLANALRRNLRLNCFEQVAVSSLALSDHRGLARIHVGPGRNTGTSSFRPLDDTSGAVDVELAALDDLVDPRDPRIRLVKIDVEGAELQVLRGMKALLQGARPDIVLEVTDAFLRELGDSAAALADFLGRFGYVGYLIGDGRLTTLDALKEELPKQFNALFTPGKKFGDGAVL